jgi:hypothetical protein
MIFGSQRPGLNNYLPYNNQDWCNVNTQQAQTNQWLAFFRTGLVHHLFWYDWASEDQAGVGSVGGLLNATNGTCGGAQSGGTMTSYGSLDVVGYHYP